MQIICKIALEQYARQVAVNHYLYFRVLTMVHVSNNIPKVLYIFCSGGTTRRLS